MSENFLSAELQAQNQRRADEATRRLVEMLTPGRQVGDLMKLDYNGATVLIHDHFRREVGGVPLGAFLVSTRLLQSADAGIDPTGEDTALLLLRVTGTTSLPDGVIADNMRYQGAKRSLHTEHTWDAQGKTDQWALNELRYSALTCRVLGTFLMRQNVSGDWAPIFGADLANFYSGMGMKVHKPSPALLEFIVNYVRPSAANQEVTQRMIRVGRVRYAASERVGDDTGQTPVKLDPHDLIARRTALFGMSRTGKSNTTKIVASSVFRLRGAPVPIRIGQLIIDPNGEYANENSQDAGSLKRVAGTAGAQQGDVVTYGLNRHPNDLDRRIIKLNFLGVEPTSWANRAQVVAAMTPLIMGKEIIDSAFARFDRRYMSAFASVSFEVPSDWEDAATGRSVQTRYRRKVTAYRALLVRCGFSSAANMTRANLDGLTNADLRNALQTEQDYAHASAVFGANQPVSWDQAFEAFRLLGLAIKEKSDAYSNFNRAYQARANSDGRSWHDQDLEAILSFMDQRGGLAELGRLAEQHSPDTNTDYADDIVADLRRGRLVIVDQSTGDPELNKAAAERLMLRVFNRQKDDFVNPQRNATGEIVAPPDVLVYVEEAHNLLPAKSDDLTNVWSRTAKEGSKFRIGLVYATQEPSSIQANILKNTDNWFIAHLNNSDELREIAKYYDFGDFRDQILTVPEPGFLRMRTLSNAYVIPVQIDPFQVEG